MNYQVSEFIIFVQN